MTPKIICSLRLITKITIHEDEVVANWSLAVNGEPIFSIEPLR